MSAPPTKQVEAALYIAIPADGGGKAPSSSIPQPVAATVAQPRSRRVNCRVFCLAFLFWTVLGMVLFFTLVPRYPVIFFKHLDLSDVDGLPSGQASFKFSNMNLYDITYSDPELKMYWLADEAVVFGVDEPTDACSFFFHVEEACGRKVHMNLCALEMAKFDGSMDVKLPPRGSDKRLLDMTSSASNKAYFAEMMGQAASGETPILISTGHLDQSSFFGNYGKTRVSSTLYCFN